MEKLFVFLSQHKALTRVLAVVVPVVAVIVALIFSSGITRAGDSISGVPYTTAATVRTTAAPTTAAATTKPVATTAPTTTSPDGNVPFATAASGSADYQAQWDAGYLVAIDNPDPSYSCYHIELTEEDRDLIEALCYGEFGSGGFIGAAMIAQCVRDAMCFDGYTSVEDVIRYCHYDGSTTSGTSDACVQAVRYIFDDDGSAVQHRMLYMYNPYIVSSDFHESQEFVLSYQQVRFFDRPGA